MIGKCVEGIMLDGYGIGKKRGRKKKLGRERWVLDPVEKKEGKVPESKVILKKL